MNPRWAERPPETQNEYWSDWNCGPDCTMRSNHLSLGSTGTWKVDHQSHRQPLVDQSEEKMSRQSKNICNTTKSNPTPVKNIRPTTARLEKPNIDEAKENDLKIPLGECLMPLKRK